MATTIAERTSSHVSSAEPSYPHETRAGLRVDSMFCPADVNDPFETVEWELRSAAIKDENGARIYNERHPWWPNLLGEEAGSLGETGALALLVGGPFDPARRTAPPAGVVLPVALTLLVQALVSMSVVTVPVFMPVAAGELNVPASHVGLFMSMIYVGSTMVAPVSGYFIDRFGPIGVSQICLVLCALGLVVETTGSYPLGLVVVALATLVCGVVWLFSRTSR